MKSLITFHCHDLHFISMKYVSLSLKRSHQLHFIIDQRVYTHNVNVAHMSMLNITLQSVNFIVFNLKKSEFFRGNIFCLKCELDFQQRVF